MKVRKAHRKHTGDGTKASSGAFDKSIRLEMHSTLWAELGKIADAEGKKQGRPKSVSAVMRKMLQAGVEARTK